MRRIALVGDISSGKTFFSKLFRYPVFNADLVVSNLYQEDKSLFRKIKKKFPQEIRDFPLKKKRIIKNNFKETTKFECSRQNNSSNSEKKNEKFL